MKAQTGRFLSSLDAADVLLFIAVAIFVWFRIDWLPLPFYWDEAWVYGPAVLEMMDNGPSLLPDAIDTDLSRGHPLLFHFVVSALAFLFGSGFFELHLVALLISVVLIASTYALGKHIGGKELGLFAAIMLMLNEVFVAQSGMLFPEVLLGVFVVLACLAYLKGSVIGFLLTLSMAVLVKESGIVLVLAFVTWSVWNLMFKVVQDRSHSKWLLLAIAALIPSVLFFSLQYVLNGWVFYPLHTDLVTIEMRSIHWFFKQGFNQVFEQQGLEIVTISICILVPVLFFRLKGWWKAISVILVSIAAIKILVGRWSLGSDEVNMVGGFALLCMLLPLLFDKIVRQNQGNSQFLSLAWIFSLGFLLFSALNFFADRYLVCLIPIYALGIGQLVESAFFNLPVFIKRVLLILILFIHGFAFDNDQRLGDCEISYPESIGVTQDLIEHLRDNNLQNEPIYSTFIGHSYLGNPRCGYVEEADEFPNLRKLDENWNMAIFWKEMPDSLALNEAKARGLINLTCFKRNKSEACLWGRAKN